MSYEICPCCGAKKPVSPNLARDRVIRENYAEGVTLGQLSIKHIVTEQRIRQIIGCDNLRLEDKHISLRLYESRQERNQEIYRLHKHGHSNKFICEKFSLSRSAVWQVIKKMARYEARASAGHQAQDSKGKNEESQQVTR